MRVSLGDTVLIWCTATATTPGGTPINLVGDAVAWAFPAHGIRPVTSDWLVGEWTDGLPSYELVVATLMDVRERYDVWLRVTDNPQVKEALIGQITVT